MDKSKVIKIAKRYINTVSKKYQIENVILFGSYAKESYHIDSDIDLAIVFKKVDDIIDLQIELLKLRSDDDLMIEPHPFRLSDFNISNPFVSEILNTGIKLN